MFAADSKRRRLRLLVASGLRAPLSRELSLRHKFFGRRKGSRIQNFVREIDPIVIDKGLQIASDVTHASRSSFVECTGLEDGFVETGLPKVSS